MARKRPYVKKWTNEENEKIKEIRENHTIQELAEMFGVSHNAMYERVAKLGLRTRDFQFQTRKKSKIWTNEENETIIKIRELYSNDELAEMFGVTKDAIYNKLRRLGLRTTDVKEEIPEGYKKCAKCKEVFPVENFFPHSAANKKMGYQSYCKLCCKVSGKRKIMRDEEADKVKNEKLEKYLAKYKDKTFFCKSCNKEKTFKDYYISYDGGNWSKHCKECDKRRKDKYKALGKIV